MLYRSLPFRGAFTGLLFSTVVLACGGTVVKAPRPPRPPAPNGHCHPSSVVTTLACPQRSLPASNASSASGCKSDADCKDGIEGRCVDTRRHSSHPESARAPAFARSPLFAGPPPPPLPTICVYDACVTNAQCGAHARCSCGEGTERNACVTLDSCLADTECGESKLCECGAEDRDNRCAPGTCRTDDDCANGLGCGATMSGFYCRSADDKCRDDMDCPRREDGNENRCDFSPETHARACRAIPLRPPG